MQGGRERARNLFLAGGNGLGNWLKGREERKDNHFLAKSLFSLSLFFSRQHLKAKGIRMCSGETGASSKRIDSAVGLEMRLASLSFSLSVFVLSTHILSLPFALFLVQRLGLRFVLFLVSCFAFHSFLFLFCHFSVQDFVFLGFATSPFSVRVALFWGHHFFFLSPSLRLLKRLEFRQIKCF